MKVDGAFTFFVLAFLALWYFLFRKPSSVNTCMSCGSTAPNLSNFNPPKSTSQLGSTQPMYDNSGNLVCPTGWHADTDPINGNPICVPDTAPVLVKVQQQADPCSSPLTWTAAQCVQGQVAQGATLN